MKTKKLWALLVAAVMVIGLLPVSAFAAKTNAKGAPSPLLSLTLGTKTVSFTASDFTSKQNNDAPNMFTVSKTVDISYDEIATGSLLLSVNGVNGTSVNVANGSANISGTGLTGNHITNFSTNVSFTSKALGVADNKLTFVASDAVTGNEWWDHDADNGSTSAMVKVTYEITFNVTAPSTYVAEIAAGSRGGTTPSIAVTNTSLSAYNGSSAVSISSPKASLLALTKPNFANAQTGEDFAYWRFDTSLEVSEVDASPSNVGTTYGSATDVKAGDKITTYVPQGTDATKFLMPAQKVVITAVDAKGNDYGTSTPGTPGAGTGDYTFNVYNGTASRFGTYGTVVDSDTIQNLRIGDQVWIYATTSNYDENYDYWTFSGCIPATSYNQYRSSLLVTITGANPTATFHDNDTTGTYALTVGSSTGGSAYADDTSLTSTQEVRVYATPASGYYFAGWSTSSNVSYASGYSYYSNPTYITLSGSGTITPTFTYGYDTLYGYGYGYGYGYPSYYYPTGTGTNTNSNTNTNANSFGTGTLQATVTTTGVTAGYNASGSINSTNTVLAVQRYFRAYPSATSVNLAIPMGATAMSKSTAQKLINAAGTKAITVTGNASFGTVSYSLTTARNYYFQMSSTGSRYTNARNTIVRAYGNSDTRGFSMQVNSLGASGTFKVKLSTLGLSVGAGDTVYALFYNPSTNGFTRKTLVVNSAGEVNYATARGGVHLFSETPFAK
jgi:hypothetical protein